jgi:hypothetical protein
LSQTFINHKIPFKMMTRTKTTYGIVTITTVVLMFAATIGSALNSVDAARDRPSAERHTDTINQPGDNINRDNVIGVQVGNVAIPIDAKVCGTQVSVGSDNENSARC